MDNVEAIIPILQTVRGLGVQIAVDDFGTGYSSLAYIARLPIHSLKIDRSFIVGMTQSQESLNIVNSVISLAHSLKLRVVAEGVETEAQSALLCRTRRQDINLISREGPQEARGHLRKPVVMHTEKHHHRLSHAARRCTLPQCGADNGQAIGDQTKPCPLATLFSFDQPCSG